MRAIIALLVVMSFVMLIFLFAGVQTYDYAVTHGMPVPWQVYALFVIDALWVVMLFKLPRSWHEKIEDLVDRLNDED